MVVGGKQDTSAQWKRGGKWKEFGSSVVEYGACGVIFLWLCACCVSPASVTHVSVNYLPPRRLILEH